MTPRLEPVVSRNAMTSQSVYATLKDRDGILWIGTQNGLHRYDGEQYRAFHHRADDSTSLSDNFILSIAEDRKGALWIGTRHGVNRYDKRTRTFRRFFVAESAVTFSHQTVGRIMSSPDGSMTLVCAGRVYTINTTEPYAVQALSLPMIVTNIVYDRDGSLIIGMAGGAVKLWQDGGERSIRVPIGELAVGPMLIAGDDLYVGSERGVFRIERFREAHGQQQRIRRVSAPVYIHILERDRRGRIWAGTDSGIVILPLVDPAEEGKTFPQTDTAPMMVRSIYCDDRGVMWVGTVRHGVMVHDMEKEKFSIIDSERWGKERTVWSIHEEPSGTLWIGTQEGVYRSFRTPNGRTSLERFARERITGGLIGTIKQLRDGTLLFGPRSGGVFRYHPDGGTLRFIPFTIPTFFMKGYMTDLAELQDGSCLMTTTNGLFRLDPKTFSIRRLSVIDPVRRNENLFLMSIMVDRSGTAWIGSPHGLYRYDPRTGSTLIYRHDPADSTSISSPVISSCFEDRAGRLWAATLGNGINALDRSTGRFTRFNTSNGLINDVVYGFREDGLGRLWMSTDNGLACFDPKTGEWNAAGLADGLPFLEFAQNAVFQHRDGRMTFGGIGGAVTFQPESLRWTSSIPPAIITDLRIDYLSVGPDDPSIVAGTLEVPQTVRLSPDQRTISFDFLSPVLPSGRTVIYSYRLTGFDGQWIVPVHRQRTAHYTHLDPGSYTFEVRTSTHAGRWNEASLRIHVIVQPPFWRTWWFLLLSIGGILAGFVMTVRFYAQRSLKERLREAEIQQKLQAERERISRELHDSTGANLSGIITGLDAAEKYLSSSATKTKRTIRSLSDDARLSMTQLRETIWAMKSNAMPLGRFSDAVEENIRRMLKYNKGITLHLQRTERDQIMLSPMQVLNLYRIVQESVTNVLTHSRATRIDIAIAATDSELTIIIENNGTRKQRRSAAVMHGYGTENMERRAAELHGTIQIQIGEQHGCRVTVTVPLRSPS